mmetsp:Transcript_45390/g.150517  ORF Transcript_45390/g.150517 Transcript_45390/m.150517 type:complete len:204 (-) Transcript_45390:99-710(-)
MRPRRLPSELDEECVAVDSGDAIRVVLSHHEVGGAEQCGRVAGRRHRERLRVEPPVLRLFDAAARSPRRLGLSVRVILPPAASDPELLEPPRHAEREEEEGGTVLLGRPHPRGQLRDGRAEAAQQLEGGGTRVLVLGGRPTRARNLGAVAARRGKGAPRGKRHHQEDPARQLREPEDVGKGARLRGGVAAQRRLVHDGRHVRV